MAKKLPKTPELGKKLIGLTVNAALTGALVTSQHIGKVSGLTEDEVDQLVDDTAANWEPGGTDPHEVPLP